MRYMGLMPGEARPQGPVPDTGDREAGAREGSSRRMNIFHFIQQDHHEIDSLLSRLQLAPDAADFDQAGRRYLLDRLLTEIEGQADADDQLLGSVLREVSVHDAIERQYLHPAIRRRLPHGNARYQQLTSELGQIGRLAAKLDIYHFHDEARAAWVRELTVSRPRWAGFTCSLTLGSGIQGAYPPVHTGGLPLRLNLVPNCAPYVRFGNPSAPAPPVPLA